MMRDDWKLLAACRGAGAAIFYPDSSGPGNTSMAKRVCADCPVRDECLADAIAHRDPHGVWGGLDEKERRRPRRRRAEVGTRSCYRNGCDHPECRQANTEYARRSRGGVLPPALNIERKKAS